MTTMTTMTTISRLTQLTLATALAVTALTACHRQATDTNPGATPAASADMKQDGAANATAASAAVDAASHTVDNHTQASAVTPGTSGGTSEANGHNTNTGAGVGTTHTGAAGGPDQAVAPTPGAQPSSTK